MGRGQKKEKKARKEKRPKGAGEATIFLS